MTSGGSGGRRGGGLAQFDVRVFDPNANQYLKKALRQCCIQNVKEKKRQYNERVLETDHGSFTPLVYLGKWEENVARFITHW